MALLLSTIISGVWSTPASAANSLFDQIFLPSGLGNEAVKVETADLDKDGNDDLILLSSQSNQLAIFMGKGNGAFESVHYHTLQYFAGDFAVGDFDGDGKLDLAVANFNEHSFSLYKGNGDGTFGSEEEYPLEDNGFPVNPQALIAVDYNNNGQMDLMIKQSGSNRIWIYEQRAGTFAEAYKSGGNYDALGASFAFGDLNGDGKTDLVASTNGMNDHITVELHDGSGFPQFTNNIKLTNGLVRDIVIADFNQDGYEDIAALDPGNNRMTILHGFGNGQFFIANTYNNFVSNPSAMAVGDFDGDGTLDLVFANYGSRDVSILLGDRNNTFQLIRYPGTERARSITAADFNKDGRTDFAVAVNPTDAPPGVVVYASKEPGGVDVTHSTVTAIPATVAADGTASAVVKVTLKDANQNVIPNRIVSLTQGTGSSTITPDKIQTNQDGVATFTVKNTKAETVIYTAKDEQEDITLTQHASVTFTSGDVDAAKSTVTTSAASVLADGIANATITVTIKDAFENPVADHEVSLTQGSGHSTIRPVAASVKTDANGEVSFTVTNTKAETVTYTAKDVDADITIQQTVNVTFGSGTVDPASSKLTANTNRVIANGRSTATLTVQLQDANQNRIAGHTVSLSQGSGRSTIVPATATTDANGIAAFTVSSRTAEKVTYSAKDLDENLTLTQTAQITFTSPYVPPPYYPVQSVSLDRDSLTFTEGDPAVKLHAVIQPSYASNQQVRWESSDPDVAIVDQTGTVTPKSAGTAIITVTTVDGNKTASAQVTVEPAAEENKLLRIEPSQSSLFLLLGDSAAFQVKAVYEDGTEEDITKDKKTVYKSSARSIASVKPGQIKAGNKDGDAIITISYEGESTEIEVTVSSADVQSIRPSFRQVVLEEDEQREIGLVATLSDRKKIEVGSSAEWMVDDPKIVSVENGKVTALAKGKTRITVSYGELSYRIAVTVVDEKKFLKLKVSNQSLHLEQDERMRLVVKGVYEDGHEVDVSEDVTWQVQDKDIAVVKKGEVIALAPGRTTVTAAYAGKKVSMSISVIEERILERLSSNKYLVKLPVDDEQSITLKAIYNDRTHTDVTDKAEWTSSDEEIAIVMDGVILAVSPGDVEIIAEYEGESVTIYVTVTK